MRRRAHQTPSPIPDRTLVGAALWALLAMSLVAPLVAAPTTFLHATDPTCAGNSPCFDDVEDALLGVDHGGTVVILSDINGSIRSTEGRRDVTLRGMPDNVLVSTQILLEEAVEGWTIQDLHVSNSLIVQDVVDSLTIANVTANTIRVGELTQNPSADITIRDSIVRNDGPLSVLGADGVSVGGSILIQDNRSGTVNVKLTASPASTTRLDADVTIVDNTLAGVPGTDGVFGVGGVSIVGGAGTGTGIIAGTVEYSRNTGLGPGSKFGVVLSGNVTGSITGHVVFRDNDTEWLAALTTGAIAGNLRRITATGNTAEALEFVAPNGSIDGPVLIENNQVLDLGGGTQLDNPLCLLDGEGVGDVTVRDNEMPEADVVVRSSDGVFSGVATIVGNTAGLLTLDSRGGDFQQPFEIRSNFLPQSANPALSRLTVRTQSGGDAAGGTIAGNTADELTVNLAGFLAGNLETTGNTVRQSGFFAASGNLGGADHSFAGNDLPGETTFNGLDSDVRFNRVGDELAVIVGTDVDATINWWGCNEGPGEPGCGDATGSIFNTAPWLTFAGEVGCEGDVGVAHFDVLTASNGATPPGNVTPGSVQVSSSDGLVDNPVALTDGTGCTNVDVFPGIDDPTVRMQLDSEVVFGTGNCPAGTELPPCPLFSDGFESGNTSAWSQTLPAPIPAIDPPTTGRTLRDRDR